MNGQLIINIKVVGERVALNLDGRINGSMDWSAAQAISRELKALAGAAIGMVCYKFSVDGRPAYIDFEPALALNLANGLYQASLKAEEHAKAEAIARDTAILYRAGAPFGLSDHPGIIELAKKEAAWNTDFRRAMPGGVKSAEAFGVPALRRGAPKVTTH